MLHSAMFSVIAIINFTVPLLHPTRKHRLKLIDVGIQSPEGTPRLNTIPSQFIAKPLSQISPFDTCGIMELHLYNVQCKNNTNAA